ncbi:MAG: tRNA epoxyqueuosine(34) reductase QueG [Prevotella sp.]|nr:tRNA epoxyqueuosine(34) reductase QueG [Prevotella sp.]
MERELTYSKIKTEAIKGLGFSACGIVRPDAVDEATAERFRSWLSNGYHADMRYMEGYEDKRLDPRLLMPEARSMICVALSYAPNLSLFRNSHSSPRGGREGASTPPLGEAGRGLPLSYYALGKDYHDVMKQRLRLLAERLGLSGYRVFCDTAPILERYWAVQAGLGWIGRNHQLIIPKAGSMFFLGEIFCEEEVDIYDKPIASKCGSTCRKCLDACPTKALLPDGQLDANRCLSYLTIENRGEIPDEAAEKMGNCFYGCDRCQLACPWNSGAEPTKVEEFFPSQALLDMDMDKWRSLTIEQYRALFKGSAVKRAKYEGLMRNISKIK